MRFRSGLVIGLALGYVLGTRAGRERYEEIRRVAARILGDARVRAAAAAATRGAEAARSIAGEGLITASERVRAS